jgi:hypothetical protein
MNSFVHGGIHLLRNSNVKPMSKIQPHVPCAGALALLGTEVQVLLNQKD